MQTRRFRVSEIHCQGCQQTINDALGDVDGVSQVDPDQASDVVTVVYDEDRITDDDAISELLGQAGFPVQQVSDGEDRPGAASRYGLLVAAVLAIALAGYAATSSTPFRPPHRTGRRPPRPRGRDRLVLLPVQLPALLGLLGRQAVRQSDDGEATARPAVFGGALALGAAVFMVLAGVVIGLGGEALVAGVTFTSTAGITIRAIVGLLLIFLGLMQTGRLPWSMHAVEDAARPLSRRSAELRREHPVAGFATFGFGYVLAGFG